MSRSSRSLCSFITARTVRQSVGLNSVVFFMVAIVPKFGFDNQRLFSCLYKHEKKIEHSKAYATANWRDSSRTHDAQREPSGTAAPDGQDILAMVSGIIKNCAVALARSGALMIRYGHVRKRDSRGLDRWFGHDGFRPGQFAPVEAVVNGCDAVVVMPTGAGKSLCFQLAALLLSGVTVTVSPLIARMRDQVAALERRRIPATFLNSTVDARETELRMDEIRTGHIKECWADGFCWGGRNAAPTLVRDETETPSPT